MLRVRRQNDAAFRMTTQIPRAELIDQRRFPVTRRPVDDQPPHLTALDRLKILRRFLKVLGAIPTCSLRIDVAREVNQTSPSVTTREQLACGVRARYPQARCR